MSKIRLVLLNIVLVLISMLGAVLIMVDFKKSVLSEFLERESWIQIIIAVVVLVVLDTGIDLWNSRKQRKEIERLNKKIIEDIKLTDNVIDKKNPYYELSQSISYVQDKQNKLSKKYDKRKREYLSLLEYIDIGILVIDYKDRLTMSNELGKDFFDFDNEWKNQDYQNYIYNLDVRKLIEQVKFTKEDKKKQIVLKIDTVQKIVETSAIYIPIDSKRYLIMLMLRDLTVQKEMEKKQLDFVGNLSHEIKTPITAITGFSETLLDGALDDKEVSKQFIEIIHDESTKLSNLVDDMITISRLNEHGSLNIELVNIFKLVKDTLQLFSHEIEKKGLNVRIEIDEELSLYCDKLKLKHIITNLIQNAIRYNLENGEIKIKVQNDKKNEWVFVISDTGIGISDEDKERIFERFYRVDKSHSKTVGGTGLGLAVVKESVDALSGRIKVKSQINKGTTFYVILPRFKAR
ncbi:sensor histidine kinase [Ligilactobacillus salivarius]